VKSAADVPSSVSNSDGPGCNLTTCMMTSGASVAPAREASTSLPRLLEAIICYAQQKQYG
jgi:hypothetical protein